MDYRSINRSKVSLLYHCVLVTKYRHKIFNHIDIIPIIRDVGDESKFTIIECECDEDHVHILIESIPILSPLSIVRRLKQMTTNRVWKQYDLSRWYWKEHTLWNDGYFITTVGHVDLNVIKNYIKSQGQFIPLD